MNAAHYHLIVNHIPLFTTLIGLLILGWGMIKKSQSINNIAFVLLIVGALSSYVALETGEGAEDIVEEQGISNDQTIHDHEEAAELAFWLAAVTGGLSIIGLFASSFGPRVQNSVNVITLIAAIITMGLLSYTAYQGGAIRHTEAYSGAAVGIQHNRMTTADHYTISCAAKGPAADAQPVSGIAKNG